MKNLALILAFVASILFVNTSEAQSDFPKADFLNTMNSFDDIGLNLSSDQSSELKDLNSGMVDKVFSVLNSDKDKESKISELKNIKSDTKKKGIDILGEDNFKSYKKSMKKKLKPFKRKTKLVKFVL
ncbi:hypothetical protein JM658_12955 [Joostella atrarenae]|uniref:Uncharacterized protein n=1 Tax=Joostella atrarenae TaxID=679257 RepID=A0ABS9J5P2_9FLAO|nr:hypothetical protein [Joostella atrarenae]MCF8715737.1 hypothetical protein [Joostella atrarenae]